MGVLDRLLGGAVVRPVNRPRGTVRRTPAYAVIDVETTGLSPATDRILELAIVRLDASGDVVDEYVTRFDPEGPVGATHIHGIRDIDVRGLATFREVAPTIVDLVAGLPIVAHNAAFDVAFLATELQAAGWDVPVLGVWCTLDASRGYLPDMPRRRLADCCAAIGHDPGGAHSALFDARAACALLVAFLALARGEDRDLATARETASVASWSAGPSRMPRARAPHFRPSTAPRRFTPPRPAQPALIQRLSTLSLLEIVDEGAPVGTTAYLELLLDALADGVITADESAALDGLRAFYRLSDAHVAAAHQALILALAHRALDDGRIAHAERDELKAMALLLAVAESRIRIALDAADLARLARLSAGLGPLPDPWPHGEPLRVGDRVVFTGCDEAERQRLELRAEELGVRVSSAVSKLTVLLVTDGSFAGGKLSKAKELGTRIIDPQLFGLLLAHLQPTR